MTKTWFTADPHIGHKNIIQYCKRPFTSVQEMDETLVQRWNDVVADDDQVFIVGDLAYGCRVDYAHSVLMRMKGWKYLLKGNHDAAVAEKVRKKFHYDNAISHIFDDSIQEIEIEEQKIVLCHYAMRSWHHDLRGTWHLFGHTHGLLAPFGKSMDVGVDAWNFTPVSFEQVKAAMDKLPIGPHPGFENFDGGHKTV